MMNLLGKSVTTKRSRDGLIWDAHKKAALVLGGKIEQRANTRLDWPRCQEFLDTDERCWTG